MSKLLLPDEEKNNSYVNNQIQEAIITPFGYDTKITSCGITIYTKDSLKSTFLETIQKSEIFSKVIDDIKFLLDQNYLVVGVTDKPFSLFNLIKRIFRRLVYDNNLMTININGLSFPNNLSHFANPKILGFFCPSDKRIVIITTNLTKYYFFINDESLIHVFSHEIIHCLANFRPNDFLKIYGPKIILFYINLIKSADEEKLVKFDSSSIKDLSEITKYLIYYESDKGSKTSIKLSDLVEIWEKFIVKNTLTTDETYKLKILVKILSTTLFLTGNDSLIKDIALKLNTTPDELIKDSINIYRTAYLKTFRIVNEDSFFGQEIIIPSEIIATQQSIKTTSDIILAIKDLTNYFKRITS